ncbi:hypothetical protein HNR63_002774 [Anoxybacillus kamchatkensis]|nr:hypothetical protein [Anoxybacillus ayderensis]
MYSQFIKELIDLPDILIQRAFCDVGFFQKKWYHSIIFFLCSSADSSYILIYPYFPL